MQDIHKTRFIAANYSNLQGLKSVPLGLLLLVVVLWANGQVGRAKDLSFPVLFAAGIAVLTWIIYRYYRVNFGRIESTPGRKKLELVLGFVGGLIGLGAFILDISFKLPVSLVGLVFAAAIVVEYLRMQWYAPGHYLLPLSLVSFAIMLVVSVLPLFGAGEWYHLLGLRIQLFAVLVVAGVVIIFNGLLWHWFFERQLPPLRDKP